MFKYKFSSITALLICIIIIVNSVINSPKNIISWDVFGYYLYLPAAIINKDIRLQQPDKIYKLIDKYKSSATLYKVYRYDNGNWIMKYSMGMAFLYSPAFFAGHCLAKFSGQTADGLSYYYQLSLIIWSLLVTFIGIYFLRRILLYFFNDNPAYVILLLICLGTNYYFTNVYSSAMPHNYLFTVYTIIIWLTIQWHRKPKISTAILTGLFIGLAILSRPSEIVTLIIPLAWGVHNRKSLSEKSSLLLSKIPHIILVIITLIIIGIPQIIYWKVTTGKFLYMSYNNPGEGFDFLSPYILKVLFSFRKGWFIYTPVMLFAVTGFYYLFKKNKPVFYPLLLFFIFNLFIVSSWSCWWYADSFGQRALVQSYPVMAITLGYLIQYIQTKKFIIKGIFTVIFIFLIILSIFQTWQAKQGILHTSRMTREYYFKIFGKRQVNESDRNLLLVYRSYDANESIDNIHDYNKSQILHLDFEVNSQDKKSNNHCDSLAFNGNYSYKLDKSNIFSPGLDIQYKDLTNKEYAWIKATVNIYPVVNTKENPTSLVITFLHEGKNYKYRTIDTENFDLTINQWNELNFEYLTPEVRNNTDNVKIYLWHRGNLPVYIDELIIEKYEPK